jgi:hypothetical protein
VIVSRALVVLDPMTAEAEIDRVVGLTNLPRPEVAAAMARLCGEDVSDMVSTEPLTDEDRARLGLNAPRTAHGRRGAAASVRR